MLPDSDRSKSSGTARFAQRTEPAELPELMDAPCTYEEFRACLRDLEKVNRFTRGYDATLEFLDSVAARGGLLPQPLRILDVGSGGGDMLRKVAGWARAKGNAVELTGIDLNPHSTRASVEFSTKYSAASGIRWITGDVFSYVPEEPVDVVLSALFTHHLSSPEVVRFVAWMEKTARVGWFINDLERSERAARWFRVLPVLFRWHRFVRHDGPVSLQRAFRREDWRGMLAEAGVPAEGATVEGHGMARLCVARLR